jgi:hypothetical protein
MISIYSGFEHRAKIAQFCYLYVSYSVQLPVQIRYKEKTKKNNYSVLQELLSIFSAISIDNS